MTNLTPITSDFIKSLNADELVHIIEKHGHDISGWDRDDVAVLQGYLLCMVDQGSIPMSDNINPFTGGLREDLEAEIADAKERKAAAKTKGTQKKYDAIKAERFAELQRVPSFWYERKQEEVKYRAESLERWLDQQIEAADATRKDLAEKLLTSTRAALHQIQWLTGTVKTLEMGRLAILVRDIQESAAAKGNPISAASAVERVVEDLKLTLLSDQLRGNSSSAYANASEDEKRAAASDFIDSMRWRFRL